MASLDRIPLVVGLASFVACSSFDQDVSPSPADGGTDAAADAAADAAVDAPSTVDASVPPKGDPDGGVDCTKMDVLVGSNILAGLSDDKIPYGTIDAFPYLVPTGPNASARCVWVHVTTAPAKVLVGVYSDAAGSPSQLVATAVVPAGAMGWVGVPLSTPVSLTADAQIWIGLTLASSGPDLLHLAQGSCGAFKRKSQSGIGGVLPNPFVESGGGAQCNAPLYLAP